MYPHERSLVRKLANKPFAIIGVNSDKDLDKLKDVRVEKNITWRSFWNGEEGTRGPISTKWCVTGWPTTYLIDKDGVIRYKNVRGKSLDKALEVLLAEMGEEVSLVGVDHEAEDAEAMKARKEEAAKETTEVSTEAKAPEKAQTPKASAEEKKAEPKKEDAKADVKKEADAVEAKTEKTEEAKTEEAKTDEAKTEKPKAESK